MRLLPIALLVLTAATAAAADDPPRPRTNLDVVVPVPPFEHQRLHYFDRRQHHVVPGTVTIDRAPYVCDRDKRQFADRDHFVAHLRMDHRVPENHIADQLVTVDGRVHFIGE